MSDLNQIGFHFVDNVYTEAQVNEHFGLLNDCKPACINILGGAQYNEAFKFAVRAKEAFPSMRVIFRHHKDGGDDGMWKRLSGAEWWQKIGSIYKGTGLTILADNESMAQDLTLYAAWHATILELAGAAGVGIAYARFSTHNPPKAQIPQLDVMYKAAHAFGKLHTLSPNLYWSLGNADGFLYPAYHIQRALEIGCKLDVTIGEYAIVRKITDAYNGYRSVVMGGATYARDLINRAKLKLPGIPVSVFSIGAWPIGKDTFSLDKDALDVIRQNLVPITIPENTRPPQTPPPVIIAPPPTLPLTVPLPRAFIEGEIAILDKQIAECKALLEALNARRNVFMKSLELKAA
jgi:hypothetical protein